MIFRHILHPATGCASFIFGCTGKRALAEHQRIRQANRAGQVTPGAFRQGAE